MLITYEGKWEKTEAKIFLQLQQTKGNCDIDL